MTARPGYDHHATARWAAEPPKRAAVPAWEPSAAAEAARARFPRSPFERDRARVLHTSALRRLAAKTQVVAVDAGDFPRTRLTHSLECAQIGRELGAVLGCDADLVDAACLAHDLGHPPFGHNGEAALAELAAPCGGFEGNAQSLRLLTRLEAKVPGAGLNLTRATLDATLKYPYLNSAAPGGRPPALLARGTTPGTPRPRESPPRRGHASGAPSLVGGASPGGRPPGAPRESPARRGHASGAPPLVGEEPGMPGPGLVKYGAYADDAEVFGWIRDGAPPGRSCLEAQVMDWADDVAYSVHDLEDGLHAGFITLPALADPAERAAISELTAAQYCAPGSVTTAELTAVCGELLALPCWPAGFDGGPESLAALKNLTSELIGRFCRAAQEATVAAAGGQPLTRYAADLIVPRQQRLECALLKGVTAYYVMRRAGAAAAQAKERELITELAGAVRIGAPGTLDRALRPAYAAASSDAARLRVVVDQIASLTDTSAVAWHARLCRLPAGKYPYTRLCRFQQTKESHATAARIRDRWRQRGRREGRGNAPRGRVHRAGRADRRGGGAAVRAAAAVQGLPARQGRQDLPLRARRALVRRA